MEEAATCAQQQSDIAASTFWFLPKLVIVTTCYVRSCVQLRTQQGSVEQYKWGDTPLSGKNVQLAERMERKIPCIFGVTLTFAVSMGWVVILQIVEY
eukprot:5522401-Amphidinium_carterae.1